LSYAASGTVSALSFWQTHALSLRRYINAEPLKQGLQPFPFKRNREYAHIQQCLFKSNAGK